MKIGYSNRNHLLNLLGVGVLATAALGACGDSSRGISTHNGDVGCTGFNCGGADGGGGSVGGGGSGGGTTPATKCLTDAACDADEYCDIAPEDPEGVCRVGCRESGCDTGQTCNLETRQCLCTSDTGCAEGKYCDAASGQCEDGCRLDPDTCEGGAVCDPATRECVGLAACCTGAERLDCELVAGETACDGTFLADVLSCEPDRCAALPPPCVGDAECPEAQYCGPEGVCIDGCRLDGTGVACPEGEICDPDKHECIEPPPDICLNDTDCPDPATYCDLASGECLPGCRLDPDNCEDGFVCNPAHECQPGCAEDADCPAEFYCTPEGFCQALCDSHDDCPDPGQMCDFATGHCVDGCRDDEPVGGNDTAETATPVPMNGNNGQVTGALVCADNHDFYSFFAPQGFRFQVTLAFDANAGDIALRIVDRDGVTPMAQLVEPGSPKRIRFPAPGLGLPAEGTYYVEVWSSDDVSQTYDLSVVLADPVDGACFLDDSEFENGGLGWNNQDHAQGLEWAGNVDQTFRFAGSLCLAGDEDWWSFATASPDAGVDIDLVVTGIQGEAAVSLYSARNLQVSGLGSPNYTTELGEPVENGLHYHLTVPRDSSALEPGNWFIRLSGRGGADIIADDYNLSIELLRQQLVCADDNAEPNNNMGDVTPSANLDVLPGIAQNGLLIQNVANQVPTVLSLCARDEDWFHFTAVAGDQITAWVTADEISGSATIEIAGSDGLRRGSAGAMTLTGQATQPAAFNGAQDGDYFVRVVSVERSVADPYVLFIQRSPTDACGADVAEVGPNSERNDTSETATDLISADMERYEYASGLVCNVEGNDLDWYTFNVGQENTRLCVSVTNFVSEQGDLDLRVYAPAEPCGNDADCPLFEACNQAAGRCGFACANNNACRNEGASLRCIGGFCGCQVDADCDIDGGGLSDQEGLCVDGECKVPIRVSTTDGSPEMVDMERLTAPPGDYYVLVNGAEGAQNSYNLEVTANPSTARCHNDWREQVQDNNVEAQATYLGNGQAGVCDAWLCADSSDGGIEERLRGDIYEIDVPANEDRTVLLTFTQFGDGRALLSAVGPDPNTGLDGYYESPNTPDSAANCMNIRAGDVGGRYYLYVTGDAMINDGNSQIDYALRVLPTVLEGVAEPVGRCAEYVVNPQDVWTIETP